MKGGRELKIVVMSATMEEEKISHFFDDAPILYIPGRQYPVVIKYEPQDLHYITAAAQTAKSILEQGVDGNILIFMPGEADINQTIKLLKTINDQIDVLPLHSKLEAHEQDKIFDNPERRKIIVATNIAETSVTIPNVTCVVDTGLVNQVEFNQKTGIEALKLTRHAQSGCIQRAGRAGRNGSGVCIRLYTEEEFEMRPIIQIPEIQRVNLGNVVLQMKKIGIKDVETFEFIDQPENGALKHAIDVLQSLGALDSKYDLTEMGHFMAEFPLDPHASRTIVEAIKYGCVDDICTIMALAGLSPVFILPKENSQMVKDVHQKFVANGSDFLTLFNVWNQFLENKMSVQWARNNYLNTKVLREAAKVRHQLIGIIRGFGFKQIRPTNELAISKAIAAGHLDSLILKLEHGGYRLTHGGGMLIFIHPSSVLRNSKAPLIVTSEIFRTSKTYAKNCQQVEPEWIAEILPPHLKSEIIMSGYDPKSGQVFEKIAIFNRDEPTERVASFKFPSNSSEAVRIFAWEIAKDSVKLPGEISKHNNKTKEAIKTIWKSFGKNRPRELDPGRLLSPKRLREIYKQRLGTIASLPELEEALRKKMIDLRLEVTDLLSSESSDDASN